MTPRRKPGCSPPILSRSFPEARRFLRRVPFGSRPGRPKPLRRSTCGTERQGVRAAAPCFRELLPRRQARCEAPFRCRILLLRPVRKANSRQAAESGRRPQTTFPVHRRVRSGSFSIRFPNLPRPTRVKSLRTAPPSPGGPGTRRPRPGWRSGRGIPRWRPSFQKRRKKRTQKRPTGILRQSCRARCFRRRARAVLFSRPRKRRAAHAAWLPHPG